LYDLQGIGINLLDLYRWATGVTADRVLRLLPHLPEGGAYWAAVMESTPDSGDRTKKMGWRNWTYERMLLSNILDAVSGANWQRGGGKGKRPDPAPRPKIRNATGRDALRKAPRAALRRRAGGAGG
jgi:hypothetical protein